VSFGWETHSVESLDLEEPFGEHFELEVPFFEHSGWSFEVLLQVIKMVPPMAEVEPDFNSFEA